MDPREPNARELHGIEYLAALDQRLTEYESVLRRRLQETPDGWRQYRIAEAAVDKVITGLYGTVPEKTLKHMRRLSETGQVIIRPKPIVPVDDPQIVLTSVLKVLVNTSIASECSICLKEGAEVKKCKLRKALMLSAPPKELTDGPRCPYADVAVGCALGEYL